MAVVTKAASGANAVTTGWTNPANAEATSSDGFYATAAPAKNATVSSDFLFTFALSDFAGAASSSDVVIDQIVVTVRWKVSTTSSVATLGVIMRDRNLGANIGTETVDSSEPTADTTETQTVTSGITADRLISGFLAARVRATRGSTNTAFTASLDFVKVDVTYSIAVTHSDSPSGSLTLGGSSTESHAVVDSVAGTMTLGGSATDSFTAGAISFSDSPTGSISLSGLLTDSLTTRISPSGSIGLSGSRSESFSHVSSPLGSLALGGSSTDSLQGSIIYTDTPSGSIALAGSSTDTFAAPGGDPIIIQKTGTSGTAVMQKAATGYTYIIQKTGTSATPVAQKVVSGWTEVSGH